jgi:HEAT repeat protein
MSTDPSTDLKSLFDRAMIGLDEEVEASEANPTGWAAVAALQRSGSREVLDAALAACTDCDALRRRVGASVLGQLGHVLPDFQPVFEEERHQGLAGLLAAEREGPGDPDVLADVCAALGHLHDPRAIPALLDLRAHPQTRVRRGVVSGLTGHAAQEAIDGLIELSADADEDVRDWATFGLGQMIEANTPDIRAALHARLGDPCDAVRGEAIEGLATRGDRSLLPFLIRELSEGVSAPLLNAATALATPDLCEALAAARDGGLVVQTTQPQGFDLTELWQEARRACGC